MRATDPEAAAALFEEVQLLAGELAEARRVGAEETIAVAAEVDQAAIELPQESAALAQEVEHFEPALASQLYGAAEGTLKAISE
jgi:hypothetical protein